MSVFDTDKADEKIDYEVIYKNKFDEINKQLEELHYIVTAHRVDSATNEHNLNDIRSKLDSITNEQNKIMNALDILRIRLNDILPKDQQIFF